MRAITRLSENHLEILAADGVEVLDLVAGRGAAHALIATSGDGPQLLRLTPASEVARLAMPPLGSAVHGYGLGVLAATPGGAAGLLTNPVGVGWADDATAMIDWWDGPDARLGDPVWCDARGQLLVVAEGQTSAGRPRSCLASLCRGGDVAELWAGSDFVSRPVTDGAGRVAFMAWDLPWMPWERSTIRSGFRGADGRLVQVAAATTPVGSAVAQPAFDRQGRLHFLCDASGFFELWAEGPSGAGPVTTLGADIGLSLSRQAGRSWVFDGEGAVLAVVWSRGRSQLVKIDLATGDSRPLETPDPPADLIAASEDGLWYASLPAEGPVSLRLRTSDGDRAIWTGPAAASASPPPPRRLMLGRTGRDTLDAFHFPAQSLRSSGLTVLNLHGGPKGLAQQRLKGALRALRDAGHDVVDLNYRGSAGFGRVFRDSLDGQWGIADVEDVLGAVEALGLARKDVVLRGPSAGGFTALNAVARVEGFAGAISYFGVTDLERLGKTTHRFEAGYLKTLVGASDLADPVFADRSPITHAHRITAPVLLLQGALDDVTPPEQSIALADRINAAGGRCELHLFEGEGHGFTRLATLATCLSLELAFLRRLG